MNMLPKEQTKSYKDCLIAFLAGLIAGAFCVLPTMISQGGTFILRGDFRAQEIPVLMLMGNALRNGEIFWNTHIDIGSDFIESLTYYGLGSPFTWVSFLFPPHTMPYVAGFLFVLKYAVTTLCAFLFINRFIPRSGSGDVKDALPALTGALLYAFSGYQAINIYYGFFHDVVAFFPLLLTGYEKLVQEEKRGFFALAVLLNALVNYYFFIQEVIFLLLYHFCREGFHPVKNKKTLAACFFEGLIGVLQAGVLFVPALLSTMRNPRTDSFINPLRHLFAASRMVLFYVRSLLFPGELLDNPSCITDYNYGSVSAYLPLVGVVLVIAYLIRHKTDRFCRLFYICLLCMFVPALGAVFNLMIESSASMQRWLFMPLLIMSLMSANVIAEPEAYPVKKTGLVTGVFIVFLTGAMYLWHAFRHEMIRDHRIFLLYTCTGLLGVVVTTLFFRPKPLQRLFRTRIFLCVSVFCVLTTLTGTLRYQVDREEAAQYTARAELYRNIKVSDERYRFFSTDNLLAMGGLQQTTGSFLSTKNSSILSFYKGFMDEEIGMSSIRMNYSNDELDGIRELLAGRYELTGEGSVTESEDALPVGCAYDAYITEDEFLAFPASQRALAMLKWIILPTDKTAQAEGFLRHEENPARFHGALVKEELLTGRKQNVIEAFRTDTRGFTGTIQMDRPGFVFFSIPYSDGFRAYVDDVPVDILKSNHLMTIPVQAGEHVISFRYNNPYVLAGLLCSVAGWVIFLISVRRRRIPQRIQGG